MKKQLFIGLILAAATLLPNALRAQSTVDAGQSTEGKEFYVTFLQGDADDSGSTDGGALKRFKLSLSISARQDAEVKIQNEYFHFDSTITVKANTLKEVAIFDGISTNTRIRPNTSDYSASSIANGSAKYCYSFHPEMVDSCVLHVTSDQPISLFASNYKAATFDAANILPVTALQDEYIIQCYTPSDHGGDGSSQGSHFAIVAVEDNTVVEYTLAADTYAYNQKGQTITTNPLKAGQVWYVWTGKGVAKGFGHGADLSGTKVKAYDATTKKAKKIAVFQGNPHTNIPFYKDLPTPPSKAIGERDHIFSQAMPLSTWGNTFVLTSSELRDRDVIRVMAQDDGTILYLNGDKNNPIHVFDFTKDTQQYWEFEIGVAGVSNGRIAADGNFFEGESFLLESTCPVAVHEFMVSKKYGKTNTSNGDPAMLWINPIEQRIDQITFATYSSENGTTHHFTNVVTTADNVSSMQLDGNPIDETLFKEVAGSDGKFKYARLDLQTTAGSHTLKGDPEKGFIAHVYGCTGNESYGYNAGGATKPLTQYITINGQVFSPDTKNTLCGEDTVKFACHPDYEFQKIKWNFGDGVEKEFTYEQALGSNSVVPHYYKNSGTYEAYVLIYRESSHVCAGQNAVDSIPITVTIGRYIFSINDIDIPCPEDGKPYIGKVFYSNEGHVNLHGDNVKIEFDAAAKADGFKDSELVINDAYFQITIPTGAKPDTNYGIHLVITSDCGGTDTTMHFMINYDKDVITQRYDNVLGLLKSAFSKPLSEFQWYRTSDSTKVEGQTSSVLNFYDLPKNEFSGDTYYVCFTVNKGESDEAKTCACAKGFKAADTYTFDQTPDSLSITATYATMSGGKVFVNADWNGKTDIECYAQWITASGKVYQGLKFDIPDGGCIIEAPKNKGLYLLRVTTDGKSRSFKFFINH